MHVNVYGGGLMGSGIAQTAAQSGYDVTLIDLNEDVLLNSMNSIQKSVKRISKLKFKDDEAAAKNFELATIANIKISTNRGNDLHKCDIAIEAIVENMKVKQELFAFLDQNIQESAILASNTSSLSIEKIAEAVKRPERVGGIHFFNPVPVMQLVEVVKAPKTSEKTVGELKRFGEKLGKKVVVCTDTPGFIVNRLLVPYMNEAIGLLERGVATAEDIDTAMKLGCGYPMGPFELLDYVGLDTTYFILDGWTKQNPNEASFRPHPIHKKLVDEGKLGRKSGQGFYKY